MERLCCCPEHHRGKQLLLLIVLVQSLLVTFYEVRHIGVFEGINHRQKNIMSLEKQYFFSNLVNFYLANII